MSDYAVVYEAPAEHMALAVSDILTQNDIRCFVRQRQLPGHGIMDAMHVGIWGEVMVNPPDSGKALELIAAYFPSEVEFKN